MDTKWVYKIGIHFVYTKLHHFVPILDFENQKYVQNRYKMGIQNGYTKWVYILYVQNYIILYPF